MKYAFPTVLVFLALLSLSIEANACQCRHDPEETNTPQKFRKVVAQTFRESSLVFSGTLVERDDKHLKFEVKQIWKGKDQAEIVFTPANYFDLIYGSPEFSNDSCAYDFKVGESYLVYVTMERDNFMKTDKFLVSKCGRTQVLKDATKDIEELNLLRKRK
jgi:hypothetical protein